MEPKSVPFNSIGACPKVLIGRVLIRYVVRDVSAAVKFYTKLLDFELEARPSKSYALLSRDHVRLALVEAKAPADTCPSAPNEPSPTPGGSNWFAIEVPNLTEKVKVLRKAGVQFRSDITIGIGGPNTLTRQIVIEDFSGNPLALYQVITRQMLQFSNKNPASERIRRKPRENSTSRRSNWGSRLDCEHIP